MRPNPALTATAWARTARRLAVLSFLVLAALALLACRDGASPQRSPLPTIVASPPPADVPLDLDAADKLLRDGYPDEAVAVYTAVADSSQGEEQRRALGSLGSVLYSRGDFAESASAITALLDTGLFPEDRGRALLLLGASYLAIGDTDAAAETFREYIDDGGPASANARLKLAATLGPDEHGAAIEELELALAENLPPEQATEALFALGQRQEQAQRFDQSIATRQRLSLEGATASDRAEALWELIALAGRQNELQLAQDNIVTLVQDYPWHPRALQALELSYASSPVPTSAERGIVYYEQGLDEEAAAAFETSLAEGDGEGTARYYLALLAERAGDNEAAIVHYDAGLATLAGAGGELLYGDIAWERALLLEALGRSEEAIAGYVDLADAAPGSTHAPESLFRAGFLRYQQGLTFDALALFERYLAVAGEETPRARVWLAKSSLAIGDVASANVHLAAAVEADPWDYYGLRAEALIEGGDPLSLDERPPDLEIETDWTETEAWLAATAGPEDVEATEGFLEGLPMRRGLELLDAGIPDEAHNQFDAVRNEIADEPWLLYRMARALDERALTEATARTAARLVLGHADPPPELLRLAYPVGWPDLVSQEADANDLPPLLLLALVRQESFFQPDALSFADALGLTQVIPTTAEEIAGQLEADDFQTSDLLRPAVSLRFGAHYLGNQLEFLDSDIPAALAAYNGGPGNAQGWQEAALGDPELFLETVAFSETRAYVELVLEHYARYRYAYGLTERLSLPLE